jgi:peptide/nickel transport system substrate-binding protein
MKKTKVLILLLCVAMIATLALTGCTPKTPDNPEPVKEKTVLNAAVTYDFDSLDPGLYIASDTDRIMLNVYEGLGKVTDKGVIGPGLAESWDFDGQTFVFHLRKGVKFHDGTEMTAKDVVYTVKRVAGLLDDKSAVKEVWQAVESVEANDDYTVTMKLAKPNAAFVGSLQLGIIPENSASTIIAQPNGTGPYKLTSYEAGVGCTLEAHEDYWGGKPPIDTVNVKFYADTTAAMLALQNHEINMMQVTEDNLELVPSDFDKIFLSNNTTILIQVNCKEGVFSDVRVRQALNYATDQQALIDAVCPGAEPIHGFVTQLQKFWQAPNLDLYPYNPEKAKQLLAEAGYPNGLDFELQWFSNLSNWYENVALILQNQWKASNINCTLVDTDWSTFLSTVYSNPDRQYTAAMFGYTGKLDPNNSFQRLLSTTKSNVMMFADEEYDKIVKEAQNELDQNKRQQLYFRAQEIIAEQAVGVWLLDNCSYIALSKEFTGYTQYVTTFWDFTKIHKK